MRNIEKVQSIISNILKIDPSKITEKTSTETLSSWDSFAHINIMMGVEETFDLYLDVEDLLFARNSQSFFRDICAILHKHQAINPEYLYTVEELLNLDTLTRTQMPNWKEKQIVILLEELYRLGKKYFGNDNFAYQVSDRLVEMTEKERSVFIRG